LRAKEDAVKQLVEDVAAFHRKIGYGQDGSGIAAAVLLRRLAYIDEEAREVHEAMLEAAALAGGSELALDTPVVAHAVQELIDLTYVIAGTFAELGIDPDPVWRAVHEANLRKVAAPGGGKAVKPPGWLPPVVPVEPLELEEARLEQGVLI
jgi:predicted HAD superfamily Cof-like phosphohydrolase